ncbi:hypothetical protein [Paludibaculum fermentans]|nr:hypothetical protein [Paludibaculum fermentans]
MGAAEESDETLSVKRSAGSLTVVEHTNPSWPEYNNTIRNG